MSRPADDRASMAPDRWQHIQDVLADAIDCPPPSAARSSTPAAATTSRSGGKSSRC